jgi:hypothetical protein
MLCHCKPKEEEFPPRPWKRGTGNPVAERRHQKLFDIFGTAHVPDFTVNLTWNPADLLSQREWPFKANVMAADDIDLAMCELPEATEPDLYDWRLI